MNCNDFKVSAIILTCFGDGNIHKTVESVINVVDEIIILNTGSFHCESLSLYDKRVIRIIDFEWGDDFSGARNFGIEMTKNDICFFIDSDEYLTAGSQKIFKDLLKNAFLNDPGALYAPLIDNLNGTVLHNNVRIFSKRESLRYKGFVHEYLCEPGSIIKNLPALILEHTGYLCDSKNKIKEKRNLALLKKQLAVEPDNLRWKYFFLRYLQKKHPERIRIIRLFSDLKLPYDADTEIYAFNVKTQFIIELLDARAFKEAFYHAEKLYEFYKDKNTMRLYFISRYLDSRHRFLSSMRDLNQIEKIINESSNDVYLSQYVCEDTFNILLNDFFSDCKYLKL